MWCASFGVVWGAGGGSVGVRLPLCCWFFGPRGCSLGTFFFDFSLVLSVFGHRRSCHFSSFVVSSRHLFALFPTVLQKVFENF